MSSEHHTRSRTHAAVSAFFQRCRASAHSNLLLRQPLSAAVVSIRMHFSISMASGRDRWPPSRHRTRTPRRGLRRAEWNPPPFSRSHAAGAAALPAETEAKADPREPAEPPNPTVLLQNCLDAAVHINTLLGVRACRVAFHTVFIPCRHSRFSTARRSSRDYR